MKLPLKLINPFTGKKIRPSDLIGLTLGAGGLWLATDVGRRLFSVAKPITDKIDPKYAMNAVQGARNPQAPSANNIPRAV